MAVSDAESTNEGPGAGGPARAGVEGTAQTGAAVGARGSVLVVDDDPTVSEVVAGYLERAASRSVWRRTARPGCAPPRSTGPT